MITAGGLFQKLNRSITVADILKYLRKIKYPAGSEGFQLKVEMVQYIFQLQQKVRRVTEAEVKEDSHDHTNYKSAEPNNCCPVCTDLLEGGESCFQLYTCFCVVHVKCVQGHVDAQLSKGLNDLKIKCFNSPTGNCDSKCKEDLLLRDLYQVMTE